MSVEDVRLSDIIWWRWWCWCWCSSAIRCTWCQDNDMYRHVWQNIYVNTRTVYPCVCESSMIILILVALFVLLTNLINDFEHYICCSKNMISCPKNYYMCLKLMKKFRVETVIVFSDHKTYNLPPKSSLWLKTFFPINAGGHFEFCEYKCKLCTWSFYH
jgi:hypothetical protein